MLLLLFDIDGTLTDTEADDARLFRQALCDVVEGGEPEVGPRESYAEATNAAMVRTILGQLLGRPAREIEVMAVHGRYVELWSKAVESGEIVIRPVPGAPEILAAARRREDVVTAVYSGSWLQDAGIKLAIGGFDLDELAVATCDDSERLSGIMNTAGIYAQAAAGVPGFSDTVVVGDGVWDAKAARAIGAGMVGRAEDPERAAALRRAGAAAVVGDFNDIDGFWNAVETARRAPRSQAGN